MSKNSIIAILAALVGLMAITFVVKDGREKTVVISVDKYVENQDKIRKEADKAREEWESHSKERRSNEIGHLNGMNIPDLAKRAIDILVRAEHPEHIVKKAINKVGLVVVPPWHKLTDPDKNVWWTIVYRKEIDKHHDWWLEQHKMTKHYRLIGNPEQSVYFSIKKDDKLRAVLAYIVIYGNTKPFYQVVANHTYEMEDACEMLSLNEARKIFPETMNLVEGIYAKHPCNPYALVPLADFHSRLAMDKVTECVVLLGRMGAKSVCVSQAKGELSNVEGGAKASVYGYNAEINATLASAMRSRMDVKVTFSGRSNVDISPSLLENSIWHKSDARLNGILQAILSGNKPKEWSAIEENESDFNFDFKAAAGILRIAEAELRSKFERNRDIKQTFHVVF